MIASGAASDLPQLLAEVFGVGTDELCEETGPATLDAWTSLKHVELVVALDDVYGVELSYREIRSMTSVAAIRAVLAARGVAT